VVPPRPLRAGDPDRVARFALSARLGSGGMGIVYLGADDTTGESVAIKVIRSDFAADPEFRTRFRREIAAARAVGGACTARLVDADPEAEDPWMATELIAGQSLAETVATRGAMDTPVVVALAAGLAEALTAIHRAGIVHRDLKPGNVILSGDGPKVIDFGIAAAVDATGATRTGVLLGSPGYMAPEQVTGHREVGPAADVFAWGLTVLYAATGRPPFGTGRADALLYRVVHSEADTSDMPERLRPAVEAALAKDPADRPSAERLLRDLIGPTDDLAAGTRRLLQEAWVPPPIDPAALVQLSTFTPTPSSRGGDRLREGDFHDSQTLAGLPLPRSAISGAPPAPGSRAAGWPGRRASRRRRSWVPTGFHAPAAGPAGPVADRARAMPAAHPTTGADIVPPAPVAPGLSASPAGWRTGRQKAVRSDEPSSAVAIPVPAWSARASAGSGGVPAAGRVSVPSAHLTTDDAGGRVAAPYREDPDVWLRSGDGGGFPSPRDPISGPGGGALPALSAPPHSSTPHPPTPHSPTAEPMATGWTGDAGWAEDSEWARGSGRPGGSGRAGGSGEAGTTGAAPAADAPGADEERARHPRRRVFLGALAAAVAGLTAFGAAHAADGGSGPRGVQHADTTSLVRVEPSAAPSPLTHPRAGVQVGGSGTPASASQATGRRLPSLSAVPVYRGAVSQLAPGRAFASFVTRHNAGIVLLDLLVPADGNGQAFFPGPDLGGDSLPNFTLYGTCDRLAFGQTPSSDPALGCTGTLYRLAGMAGHGASFDYAEGFYRLHGYFRVDAGGGTRRGLPVVNLHAIDPRTLPA
jgi:serine/threonine protein kinase